MKKTVLSLLLFTTFLATSQTKEKGAFFNANLNLTFALNENYVLFEPDDGENILDFSAVFIRTGFGYRFNKRIESSINFGLDFHTRFNIQAIPSYLNLQYNVIANEEFKIFVNGSQIGSTDTSGTIFNVSVDNLDFESFNGGSNFYGKVKQVIVFNTALSDVEMITLTS